MSRRNSDQELPEGDPPIVEPPLYNDFDPTRFRDVESARAHFYRQRYAPVNDTRNEVEHVRAHMLDWVRCVYQSIVNTDEVHDGPTSVPYQRFHYEDKKYDEDDLMAASWMVVDECVRYHDPQQGGFRQPAENDQSRSSTHPDRLLSCWDRMTAICATLRTEKAACRDVMEGIRIPALVGAPNGYARRKSDNRKGNSKKKEILDLGRRLDVASRRGNTNGQPTRTTRTNARSIIRRTSHPIQRVVKRTVAVPLRRGAQAQTVSRSWAQAGPSYTAASFDAQMAAHGLTVPSIMLDSTFADAEGSSSSFPPAAISSHMLSAPGLAMCTPGTMFSAAPTVAPMGETTAAPMVAPVSAPMVSPVNTPMVSSAGAPMIAPMASSAGAPMVVPMAEATDAPTDASFFSLLNFDGQVDGGQIVGVSNAQTELDDLFSSLDQPKSGASSLGLAGTVQQTEMSASTFLQELCAPAISTHQPAGPSTSAPIQAALLATTSVASDFSSSLVGPSRLSVAGTQQPFAPLSETPVFPGHAGFFVPPEGEQDQSEQLVEYMNSFYPPVLEGLE